MRSFVCIKLFSSSIALAVPANPVILFRHETSGSFLRLFPGSGSNGPFADEPKSELAWKEALASQGKKPRNHEELLQLPFIQLYDLKADPGEKRNLATKRPDLVKRLIELLRAQVANGRSTPGSKLKNGKERIHIMQRVSPFVWKKK